MLLYQNYWQPVKGLRINFTYGLMAAINHRRTVRYEYSVRSS